MTQSVAEFFDRRARRYDTYFDARSGNGYALRSRMAAVLRALGDGPGNALDAGMGPGRLCAELDRRGWIVSGVDTSAEMVEIARTRLPSARERLIQAPIEALPFADASFDVATATGVLEYADLPSALRQLSRVLRPGGIAAFSYPNSRAMYSIWKTRWYYPIVRTAKRVLRLDASTVPGGSRELPPPDIEALLRSAGLEPLEHVHTSFLPVISPLDTLLPPLAAWLGERVERRVPQLGPRLATQVVYTARKPAAGTHDTRST